jgi:glycosyltransferase involved in cell wall biosynthesis
VEGLLEPAPVLSVVIPTRNRANLLAASLRSLEAQSLPRHHFEVIVVDDGSTDGTRETCAGFERALHIRYFRLAPSGISAAKNLGIFVSTGRLLLFFDDDDIAGPDLLSQHIESHAAHPEENIAILGYTTWAPEFPVTPVMKYATEIGQNLFSYPCITHGQELGFTNFWGGRTSCKRSLLVRYGIFNQGFTFGSEDIELAYRLARVGLKVIYNQHAVSYMNRPLSYDDLCKRSHRQGRSQVLFSRLHQDPVIQEYCQAADADRKWREASRTLERDTARVHTLQASLEGMNDEGQRALALEELWALYRRTFHAFTLKGFVEGSDSTQNAGSPPRKPAKTDDDPPAPAATRRARLIAFYLPQFHPIVENDMWWGRGFTEWTNVAKARPLFPGHYQPHIPAHMGFYDLRLPETRAAQADLAVRHGVEAFCYWHYWFNGERLLETPFNAVLESGEPGLPFCLAWANESWSRRWLGDDKEILKKQTYSVEDDVNHARWLIEAFRDRRYVRVQGRPLFLVYRPNDLPDPKRMVEVFRSECARRGELPPYLLGIDAHCPHIDCRTLGFDGTVDFEPQLGVLPGIGEDGLKLHDYAEARGKMRCLPKPWPRHPCVFVGWDNTPRRGKNAIVIAGSPEDFESALTEAVDSVAAQPADERLVFVNAWNEWAEGNHLEPDLSNGLAYLEAVARVNDSSETRGVTHRAEALELREG